MKILGKIVKNIDFNCKVVEPLQCKWPMLCIYWSIEAIPFFKWNI